MQSLSIWKNLNPLYPRKLCAKFDWNWSSGSVSRRRFFKFVNVFSPFRNYLPLKEDEALNMNKLEFPSPKDDFCQFWLKLTQWFWRRRFYFKFVNVFSQFLNYLPLEKGVALYLNKIEFPSPKDVLCQPHFWRPKFIIIMNFSDKALKI